MTTTLQQKIEALVLPILERMGYKLWGCSCQLHQKQRLLRIYIDKPDGIGLEDCEQVSRAVSAALDVDDVIAEQYRLEISSPGFPKPLFYPWQYQENMGHKVKLKLFRLQEGSRWLSGEIIDLNEHEVTLRVEEKSLVVAWSNITKAFLD